MGSKDEGVNKGLARAARFVNLFALGEAGGSKVHVVLHGQATRVALSDVAHRREFGEVNPNTEIIRSLRKAGEQIRVCGQAVIHVGYGTVDAGRDVEVTLSAMTAIVNRQMDGFAYLPIP